MAKQEKSAAELYREERKARIAKAAKKNAKKQHKVILTKGMKKAIAAVVVLALVAGIGAFAVNNSGMLERGKTAFMVGDVEVTSAEYGFYYSSAFNNYFQYSYQYDTYYGTGMGKLYTGYDYSISPDEQKYEGEEIEGVENPMFTDFFEDQAIKSIKYVKGSVKYAEENGITLDEDDYAEIDATLADYKEGAKGMNYSLPAYLRTFFHKGMTESLLKKIIEEQTITTKVQTVKSEEYSASYTDAKIEKTYFDELKTYGKISLRYFDIAAEKETVKADKEGEEDTQEVTDKTMAAAKVEADKFVAALKSGTDFKALAAKYAEATGDEDFEDYKSDDTMTLMEDAAYGDLSYETSDEKFLNWAIDTNTKAGEIYVVENEDVGYTVFMMVNPVHKAPDSYTYDVRHILVKFPDATDTEEEKEEVAVEALDASAYEATVDIQVNTKEYTNAELYIKAQDILKEYLDGDKTEELFGELAAKYSEDGNAAEGGIYEDVTEGYMVAEFENWALKKGREAGDVGIVETQYGYHIMYFIGSEKTTWSDTIRHDLADEEYAKLAEKLESGENVEVTGKVEEELTGVDEFIVALAKQQIRNIKANASASSY